MLYKCFVILILAIFIFTACTDPPPSSNPGSEQIELNNENDIDTETMAETPLIEMHDDLTEYAAAPLDTPTYIEQEFIDLLENALYLNEYEILKDLTIGKLLSKEEFIEIDLGTTTDFVVNLLDDTSRYSLYHEILLVDADNDGIDDLVLYLHSGGSAGFVSLDFYKGYGEDLYKHTYSSPFGVYTENAFINYNEKTYFLLTSVDYNRKVQTGFDVFCFDDGVVVERAAVQKKPESYVLTEKKVVSDDYDKFSIDITDAAPSIYFEGKIIVGSSETRLSAEKEKQANELQKNLRNSTILTVSSWYKADIDNDGIDEIYSKGTWEPSNASTFQHLTFDCIKESQIYNLQSEFGLDLWEEDRIPQYLWVENIDGKNIICVLSTKQYNSEDANSKDSILIDCYYISNSTCETIVMLEFLPNYKISTEIYTQDVNRDFINNGATDTGKG